jgi:hypothetical protein
MLGSRRSGGRAGGVRRVRRGGTRVMYIRSSMVCGRGGEVVKRCLPSDDQSPISTSTDEHAYARYDFPE